MLGKNTTFKKSMLSVSVALAAGTLGSTAMVNTAFAQDEELEEIVVTGSRIVRRDFEANSPIVSVEQDLFEQSGTLSIETVLNQLPQFVPALTQFVTTDVQNTPTNSVGSATINLRGLGANRNLVLMDGRRAQPVNALLVVDTNTIPSSAIERVELVTGGASATYGADAVSGVVNFIMKKNFEGVELDTQYSETAEGDGSEWRTSALFGANFADGDGNVMLGMEYYKRGAAVQPGREFYDKGFIDPTVNGNIFFFPDTYVDFFATPPDQAVVDSIFTQGTTNGATRYFVNRSDGTLFTGGNVFGGGDTSGTYRYNGPLDRSRKFKTDGVLHFNLIDRFVSFPLDRYAFFARGDYDIAEGVNLYGQANYSIVNTSTRLLYTPAVGGWSASIPHGSDIYAPSLDADGVTTLTNYIDGGGAGLDCPTTGGCTNSQAFPVPPELGALLDSRANPNAPFTLNRQMDYIPPRSTDNNTQTFQSLVGVNVDLEMIDGTWDTYMSYGETNVASDLIGFGDLEGYRNIVTQPNYGRGAEAGGAFSQGTATCTSGLPIFENFSITGDCADAIGANLVDRTIVRQYIAETNVQGHLIDLPAGEARFAAGAQYRENEFDFIVNHLGASSTTSSTVMGLFSSASVAGSIDFVDVYAEALIPVLNDTIVQSLNLELGARASDYGPDTAKTYKALMDMQINDTFTIRGGWQLANRAPNVGELFSPPNQQIVGTAYGDPCGPNSTAPWGANPQYNSNSAAAVALCSQLMGPEGAAAYYSDPPTGTPSTITGITESGNPNLLAEEADTLTWGVVFNSPWDHALLSGITGSLDWYEIDISDVIGSGSYDDVYENCLSQATNPSQTPTGNPACNFIQRDPFSGGGGTTNVQRANVGTFKTSGMDLQLNWSAELADIGLGDNGGIAVNLLVNWLDEYLTQNSPDAPLLDSKGTGADGGQFDSKVFTTINYFNGPLSASLRWRHYPDLDHASSVQNPATTQLGTNAYDIFDLNVMYNLAEKYEIRLGVNNLLDTPPEIYGRDVDTTAAGSTLTGYYDVLGRRYYAGVKVRF